MMLPRKTGPAPIFNYRKRPRQAVVADPETQQSNTVTVTQDKPQPPAGQRISQPPPPPASYASTSRPATSFAARGSRGASSAGTRPQGPAPAQGQRPPPARPSLPGQPMVQGSWRGMESRPGPKAMAPNRDWRSGATPIRSPAEHPGLAGPSSASSRRQQPPYQRSSSSAAGGGGGGGSGGVGGGGGSSNNYMSSVQHSAAPPKKTTGGGDDVRSSTDKSLRVLTLPVAHVKRAFGVLSDTMPAFLFCLFGIVDSATVTDSVSSGKSFTLRDESGRITCVFCEIDRRMPRLHRGQWYRAVGVAKPSWQALQCLSLRPVSVEERQAARAVTSLAIAQLNDICVSVTEM